MGAVAPTDREGLVDCRAVRHPKTESTDHCPQHWALHDIFGAPPVKVGHCQNFLSEDQAPLEVFVDPIEYAV